MEVPAQTFAEKETICRIDPANARAAMMMLAAVSIRLLHRKSVQRAAVKRRRFTILRIADSSYRSAASHWCAQRTAFCRRDVYLQSRSCALNNQAEIISRTG